MGNIGKATSDSQISFYFLTVEWMAKMKIFWFYTFFLKISINIYINKYTLHLEFYNNFCLYILFHIKATAFQIATCFLWHFGKHNNAEKLLGTHKLHWKHEIW